MNSIVQPRLAEVAAEAANQANYTQWLDLQCRMLPQVSRALVVSAFSPGADATERGKLVAAWPDASADSVDLRAAAELAARRKSHIVSTSSKPDTSQDNHDMVVAYPLLVGEPDFAVVVIELAAAEQQRSAVLQLLQWGESWLRLLNEQAPATAGTAVADETSHEILQAACKFDRLAPALALVATTVANTFGCEQVAVGLRQRGRMVLRGISDSAGFDARTSRAKNLEELMEECVEHATVIEAPSDSAQAFPAHQRSVQASQLALCSVPLQSRDRTVGVLVLQRRDRGLSAKEQQQLLSISGFLATLFETRRQREQPVSVWFGETLPALAARYVGEGAGKTRYMAIAGLVLLAVLLLGSGEHRVSAPANLEGRIQRAVVAPIDGFVLEAHARAGETVTEGQLIAELDDRELRLELARLQNHREELGKQYRKELAGLNQSQSRIVQSQIAQAEAELQLLQGRLQRTQLLVPFDGVIIEGDLSRSLGAPVEKGQVLFEIAPLDEYRLVLQVDERDITHVRAGQSGLLHLNSQPGQGVPFEVDRVATVHALAEGKVVYRTEARLSGEGALLRPGMQGVAKVDIGQRSYLWLLFHRISDWFRLTLWSWLP
jgi:multidrug efflux pump subunit AcrA (membrane-fusion protein)